MTIIFMRHGEATDNVNKIISDREIYWSVLTESGIQTVLESVKALPQSIDKIYVSSFPRTIQTAHYVSEKYPGAEVIIENRLHEIYHGKYSNNEDLDNTRIKQINGDYFTRLGEYGENKYDIEERLCSFLKDVYNSNFNSNTIAIIAHGSIISYLKRILCLKSPHIKTGKIEEFNDVDLKPFLKYMKKLSKIKSDVINKRVNIVEGLEINSDLKSSLITMAKKEFNNIEFSDDYFVNFINGLKTKNLEEINHIDFDDSIILVCFYNDFENFAKKWMNHYLSIGIKNFVLIDNNSTDNSTILLKNYKDKVNISFWKINEMDNCYKMCGWKQLIFEFYGYNRKYLTVDSDELFIYKDYKEILLEDFIKREKVSIIKTMMLDLYSNKNIDDSTLEDFNYVDKNTYKITISPSYGKRFIGGPRSRVLGINSSLQKISFINYTGKEVFANDHFYYPWNINNKAKFCAYLLHYNFLSDKKKNIIKTNNNISFYDENFSILIDNINFSFKS